MKDDNFRVVATKVSTAAFVRLRRLAKKKGLTIYELAQMVYDTLIRYMDDAHNLSQEMEQAMSIFEHMLGWQNALNLADHTVTKEIGEATYYLVDQDGQKKGTRAVHVSRPFFGNWQENTNVQQILERTICLLTPERYRRLRILAVERGCSSLLELLDIMIDFHAAESDVQELRKDFEDADRSDFGIKPTDQPYKRKHYKSPDSQDLWKDTPSKK